MEWIKGNEDSRSFFTQKSKEEIDNKEIVKFFENIGEIISSGVPILEKYDPIEVEYVLFLNPVLVLRYFSKGDIDNIIIFVKNILKIGDKLSETEKEITETLKVLSKIIKKITQTNRFEIHDLCDFYEYEKLEKTYIKTQKYVNYLNQKYVKLQRDLSNIVIPREYLRAMERNWIQERKEERDKGSE